MRRSDLVPPDPQAFPLGSALWRATVPVDAVARPARCRAIILSLDGGDVLGIERRRPGASPYVVFPGGGVEADDESAWACIRRELGEEVGLGEEDVVFADRCIVHEQQLFFIGRELQAHPRLQIGWPEAGRDRRVHGTYRARWFARPTLVDRGFVPREIAELVVAS